MDDRSPNHMVKIGLDLSPFVDWCPLIVLVHLCNSMSILKTVYDKLILNRYMSLVYLWLIDHQSINLHVHMPGTYAQTNTHTHTNKHTHTAQFVIVHFFVKDLRRVYPHLVGAGWDITSTSPMSGPRQLLNINHHEFQATLLSLEMRCARRSARRIRDAFHQGMTGVVTCMSRISDILPREPHPTVVIRLVPRALGYPWFRNRPGAPPSLSPSPSFSSSRSLFNVSPSWWVDKPWISYPLRDHHHHHHHHSHLQILQWNSGALGTNCPPQGVS